MLVCCLPEGGDFPAFRFFGGMIRLRDRWEVRSAALSSRKGSGDGRISSPGHPRGRFAAAFIPALLDHAVAGAGADLGLDPGTVLRSLGEVVFLCTGRNRYEAVRSIPADVRALFGWFGIAEDELEWLAVEYSRRSRTDARDPVRSLPGGGRDILQINTHRKPGAGKMAEESPDETPGEPAVKSKGGRPKGRKDAAPRKPRSDKGKPRGSYIRK